MSASHPAGKARDTGRDITPDTLGDLIAARLLRQTGPVLANSTATVVFDAEDNGCWTIRLAGGRAEVHPGADPDPVARVTATADVLRDVVEGRMSGVRAYLDGNLVVRGHLALAMELDGAFDTPDRPVT